MKVTAVRERLPSFLSKNYPDGKLKLLGSQTSGTKTLRCKKLSSHFDQILIQIFVISEVDRVASGATPPPPPHPSPGPEDRTKSPVWITLALQWFYFPNGDNAVTVLAILKLMILFFFFFFFLLS